MNDEHKVSIVSTVIEICKAYETGYGDGQKCPMVIDPYPGNKDLQEAYKIGFDAGMASEVDRIIS